MGNELSGPKRLLILDDEADVGATIANIARSAGFEALSVTSSDAFFAEINAWSPSHLALDLVMPHVDGIEVLRRLGGAACKACIIITSGVGSRVLDAAKRSALEHGLILSGVVSKPFTPSKFRALLAGPGVANDPRGGRAPRHEVVVDADMLHAAMEGRELTMAYQPKTDCRSGRVIGFEALARWMHPIHGVIPPDRFIVAAEHLGLMDPLTAHLFDIALDWFREIRTFSDYILSFNISRSSLGDIAFADRLARQCTHHEVPPERVILELTETSALADPTTSLDLLTRLRVKGFRLSIDDFGVGYSSIAQLVRLPFSELKIDKSFVFDAAASSESRTIIRTMVNLGHSLDLTVTAEGVEDGDALKILADAGCDLAQGYFIARPMPATAVRPWLEAREGGA